MEVLLMILLFFVVLVLVVLLRAALLKPTAAKEAKAILDTSERAVEYGNFRIWMVSKSA